MNNYKQLIKNKISSLVTFLRNVYDGIDNDIRDSLNTDYENDLLVLASMIPNDWIDGFYDSIDLVWDLVKCIKIDELTNTIKKHRRARFWFEVDTFNGFTQNFVIDKGYGIVTEKAIMNICRQFKPIFAAIDKLFSNPNDVLSRISLISQSTDENNNILNSITL